MANRIDDDVLQLVFEEFVRRDSWKWPDAEYDQDVAERPFLLAAVSRHWRSLALATATLWAYFGFPGDARSYPKHSERLRVLLDASKNALVDIIVTLGSPYDFDSQSIADEARDATAILTALGLLGPRWRNVRFRLPSNVTEHLRPALEAPLPNLTSLSAVTSVTWNILPPAPRLEQLYVEWGELAPGEVPTNLPNWNYPLLSSFTVMGELLAIAIYMHNFSTLTHICFNHDMRDPPETPLYFPQALSLTLDDALFLPHIRAPRLIQLGVRGNSSFNFSQPLSGFETVELLVLYGDVTNDITEALEPLSGIRMLDFHIPNAVWTCLIRDTEWSISSTFFSSLNEDTNGPTWPRLERIRLRLPREGAGETDYDTIDLLNFIQVRNTDLALAQRTARIAEIIVDKLTMITDKAHTKLAEMMTTVIRATPLGADK